MQRWGRWKSSVCDCVSIAAEEEDREWFWPHLSITAHLCIIRQM